MSIDLSPPNEQFLDSIVSTGVYPSRSDAVNEAVELLRRRELLRAEIKVGIDQLDRGEGEPLDMDEVLNDARVRIGATL